MLRLLWLAPIPTAWVIGPGLVGMVALFRRPMRFAPEWLLLAVPWFVVTVFQYTPRYRLPAIPVIVVAAAWSLTRLVRWRANPKTAMVTVLATAAAMALGPINRATGFENPAGLVYNNEYNLAVALGQLGPSRDAEAITHLRRALSILPNSPEAHNALGGLLDRQGDWEGAVHHYEQALRFRPGWAQAECNLGVVLARRGRFEEAIEYLRRAQQSRPDWPEITFNLANVLGDSGQSDEAIKQYHRALTLRPDYADAHDHLGIVLSQKGQNDQAVHHWQEALRIDPTRSQTRHRLAIALARRGEYERAILLLRQGLSRCPNDRSAANNLAWLLATCPRDDLRRGAEALELAERVCRDPSPPQPAFLDSLAAAYAELGQFDRAAAVVEQAIDLALLRKEDALAERLRQRRELYRQGRPYREKY